MATSFALRQAVQALEATQVDIVRSFRAHVEGEGPGPSDEMMKRFALLAVNESARRREHVQCLLKAAARAAAKARQNPTPG